MRIGKHWSAFVFLTAFFALMLLPASLLAEDWEWQANTPLPDARGKHTSALLDDERIVVIGGENVIGGSYTYPQESMVYDPETDTWTPGASLPAGRTSHQMTALQDGTFLIAGGGNSSENMSSCLIYTPDAGGGSFSTTGDMSLIRIGHQLLTLGDGRALVIGGTDGFGVRYSSCELYDPATGTWSTTGEMSEGRSIPEAILLSDGRVLVTGGNVGPTGPTTSCEIYDPATESWSSTGAMSTGRQQHRLALLPDGRVIAMGGLEFNPIPTVVASTEIYDPATETWTAGPSMSLPRASFSAQVGMDGRVFVVAGMQTDGECEYFDPADESWHPLPMHTEGVYNASLDLLSGNRFFIVGGSYTFGEYTADAATLVDTDVLNLPPSDFALLSPEDGWQETVPEDNLLFTVPLAWEASEDPDGDAVTYTLTVDVFWLDGSTHEVVEDLTETSYEVQPAALTGGSIADQVYTIEWSVTAHAGEHEVACEAPFSFTINWLLDVEQNPAGFPNEFALERAYPNPFNSELRIELAQPRSGHAELAVYDLLGRRVALLHRGSLAPGQHAFTWNARVPAGTYLLRATGPDGEQTAQKVTLLK